MTAVLVAIKLSGAVMTSSPHPTPRARTAIWSPAASEALVRFERVYQPASPHRQLYDDLYAVFRTACVGLAESFRGLG